MRRTNAADHYQRRAVCRSGAGRRESSSVLHEHRQRDGRRQAVLVAQGGDGADRRADRQSAHDRVVVRRPTASHCRRLQRRVSGGGV